MSRMSELIYPNAPGFKVSGPSEQAAEAIGGNASKLRAAVLAQFATYTRRRYCRRGCKGSELVGLECSPSR